MLGRLEFSGIAARRATPPGSAAFVAPQHGASTDSRVEVPGLFAGVSRANPKGIGRQDGPHLRRFGIAVMEQAFGAVRLDVNPKKVIDAAETHEARALAGALDM
jgi:hypothetical protein